MSQRSAMLSVVIPAILSAGVFRLPPRGQTWLPRESLRGRAEDIKKNRTLSAER